jgi:methyl-accepting chemotaxis protein
MDQRDIGGNGLDLLLRGVRALADEVRRIAERVHAETEETHRLAAATREETERSRELSKSGRAQAEHVQHSLEYARDPVRDKPLADTDH